MVYLKDINLNLQNYNVIFGWPPSIICVCIYAGCFQCYIGYMLPGNITPDDFVLNLGLSSSLEPALAAAVAEAHLDFAFAAFCGVFTAFLKCKCKGWWNIGKF